MRRATFRNRSPDDSTWQNTPALKAFFRCLETSGSVWTDSVGGISWTCPGNLSLAPTPMLFNSIGSVGTVQPVMAISQAPTLLSSGAWPAISTQSVLLVYAGRINILDGTDPRFAIGDLNSLLPGSNSSGYGLSNGPFHCACGTAGSNHAYAARSEATGPVDPTTFGISDTTIYSSVPPLVFSAPQDPAGVTATGTAVLSGGTTGTLTGITVTNAGSGYLVSATSSVTVNGVGGMVVFTGLSQSLNSAFQGDDVVAYSAFTPGSQMIYKARQLADPGSGAIYRNADAASPSYTLTPGPFSPYACMRTANVAFYGAALFVFENGLPVDYETAAIAMGGMWRAGQRYTLPSWIGLT